jgi:hypothetical protein
MLNRYINYQLPHTCFDVCYTIFREIIALLAEQLYDFCNVAIKCTIYPVILKLQCCYNCVMSYENTRGTKKLIQKVGFTFESSPAD